MGYREGLGSSGIVGRVASLDPGTSPLSLLGGDALPRGGAHRLTEARQLVEDGAISVVSLDVFDTLLWRIVPRPSDAFLLLGTELLRTGLLRGWVDPPALRRLRMTAEERARARRDRNGAGTEVTLEEIWAEFPPEVLVDANPGRMADREVELERRVTHPDLDIVDFAAFATERGCSLILVSNTYLTIRRLARLIGRPELEAVRTARLFPSCAFGVHKANGLWKVVLQELDVAGNRVLHVGDEVLSDVEVPHSHGIQTVHYPRMGAATEEVLRRDGVLPPDPLGPAPAVVHPVAGDLGFTGLRAKVAGRVESGDLPPDLAAAWHFGASVLGPVLTGFADWVHRRVSEIGVRNVWCMMREGEFLADLVARVAAHRDDEVAVKPIWLSRHVTARATLAEANSMELRKLLMRRLSPTVGQYIGNLGLSLGEVPEFRPIAEAVMDHAEVVDPVIDGLSSSDHLRARILAEAAQARQRLIGYLRATIGDGTEPTVLVDLGWGGTIQYQLATVLKVAGIPGRLVGLYLATNEVACDRILDGLEISGYLTSCGTPEYAIAQIGRSPEVIEQACLATAGSVVDFTDDGTEVLDGSIPPPAQVVSKLVTQHGVRAFQQEWLRYEGSVGAWPALDGTERQMLLEILRASVVRPTRQEARTYGAWTHEDNFGVERRERIVPDRLGPYVPYLSPPDLLEMTMQDAFWPLGLASEYDPALAAATQAVIDGAVPMDAFNPGRHPAAAELRVDCGEGFGEAQRRPLRTNRNGLSYLRFVIEQPGIQVLRFDPCDHPGVFRVDWIELLLKVAGHADVQRVRIEGESQLAGLVYSGCRWLYDGVAVGLNDDPQVHIPLAGRAAGDVYAVEVQVALAVLPLPVATRAVDLDAGDFGGRLAWTVAKIRSEAAQGGLPAVGRGVLRIARRAVR